MLLAFEKWISLFSCLFSTLMSLQWQQVRVLGLLPVIPAGLRILDPIQLKLNCTNLLQRKQYWRISLGILYCCRASPVKQGDGENDWHVQKRSASPSHQLSTEVAEGKMFTFIPCLPLWQKHTLQFLLPRSLAGLLSWSKRHWTITVLSCCLNLLTRWSSLVSAAVFKWSFNCNPHNKVTDAWHRSGHQCHMDLPQGAAEAVGGVRDDKTVPNLN